MKGVIWPGATRAAKGERGSLLLLLLLVTTLLLLVCVQGGLPRGVDPSQRSIYARIDDKFKCIDGTKVIAFDRVNDGYCDCLDGSDEPGAQNDLTRAS